MKSLRLASAILCLGVFPLRAENRAPDFSLPDTSGVIRKLSDYRGNLVVLEWFNHDCPFVKKHYSSGNMQKLQSTYRAKGVVWLSILSSAPGKQGYADAAKAKADALRVGANPTAILLDPEGKVGRLYKAKTTPHMFVIGKAGNILYQGAIDNKPSTNPEDVKAANNYVARALDQALLGQPVTVPSTKPYGCSVKYAD